MIFENTKKNGVIIMVIFALVTSVDAVREIEENDASNNKKMKNK